LSIASGWPAESATTWRPHRSFVGLTDLSARAEARFVQVQPGGATVVPAGTAITIRLLSSRSQPPRKIHWGRLVEIPAQAPLRLILKTHLTANSSHFRVAIQSGRIASMGDIG